MQDEPTPVIDEGVVADAPQTESPAEPQLAQPTQEAEITPEVAAVAAPAAEEEQADPESPEEAPAPSRRENLRIQQLLAKYGPPPERPAPQRKDALNYQDALDADPEVYKQLEADRRAEGQAQYNEGLKTAEFIGWNTSLKIDAPAVEKKYPILDKNSPEFHPAVANAINTWYLNMSGYDPNTRTVSNPNVSYQDFAEGFMELVQETAGQKSAETAKNVAKQAATTGLRPDGSSAKRLNLNKAPQDMTLEELYAKVGQPMPKQ